MSAPSIIEKLCAAGPITSISRVGYAPFKGDDPLEIFFESGAVFYVDIGFEGATDIDVGEGPLIEHAYGHLRAEEPATFAAIERDWGHETLDLPWLEGASLTNPRRLIMTNPYRVDVGYVFDAGGKQLALFGEADWIWAIALDDPEITQFALEVGASL
ncbi:hypothetical protein U91I_00858 [alpha proteobacterium U9-1i]|nr:hypothetical protein U91I_00858 [alpha proteobacterium U9-1i]